MFRSFGKKRLGKIAKFQLLTKTQFLNSPEGFLGPWRGGSVGGRPVGHFDRPEQGGGQGGAGGCGGLERGPNGQGARQGGAGGRRENARRGLYENLFTTGPFEGWTKNWWQSNLDGSKEKEAFTNIESNLCHEIDIDPYHLFVKGLFLLFFFKCEKINWELCGISCVCAWKMGHL